MKRSAKNEIGNKYGSLTVESFYDGDKKIRGAYFNCICDCGKKFIAHGVALRRESVKSCGCSRNVSMLKHGDAINTTKEYMAWAGIKQRCHNPNFIGWVNYGGRGISICESWHYFENFLKDMGRAPTPKHSIDRIDVNGNYEPNNCRWATSQCQNRNTRRKYIQFEVNGEIIHSWDLCELVNIPYSKFEYHFKTKKLSGQEIFNKFKS